MKNNSQFHNFNYWLIIHNTLILIQLDFIFLAQIMYVWF